MEVFNERGFCIIGELKAMEIATGTLGYPSGAGRLAYLVSAGSAGNIP